jgi:hypothetical protein
LTRISLITISTLITSITGRRHMTENLRVHIAPVGHEPPERVTTPLINYRADKVYLVSHLTDSKEAAENVRIIHATLKKSLASCEIQNVRTDIWNLFSCLETCREICSAESKSHVYTNVSTGSKIIAIAGMLSCMLWGGHPYYAEIDYASKKFKRTDDLPVYKISQPSRELLQVISMIGEHGGVLSKKELIGILQAGDHPLIPSYGADASKSAPHSRLRAIIGPLESEWGFVEVKAKGRRSEVTLTEQGKSALRIFGDARSKRRVSASAGGVHSHVEP